MLPIPNFSPRPPKQDGGVYVARDNKRVPSVVRCIYKKVHAQGVDGLVTVYQNMRPIRPSDVNPICCTPKEFARWYRPRRQFLFWKERI